MIPTGYSFNLDGTCIYLTLGALFIVQATGQDMAIGEQIALAALMILTSKGAAGITGAGLVTLTASLQAFGGTFFSAESIAVGIALVVGIDRIMSEGRALTNCIGNGVATMVIAKWQGERDDERFQARAARPGDGRGRDRARAARRGRQHGRARRRPLPARAGARPSKELVLAGLNRVSDRARGTPRAGEPSHADATARRLRSSRAAPRRRRRRRSARSSAARVVRRRRGAAP